MSLTKTEIQTVIDEAKAAKATLDSIDNPSAVSIWKLIRDAVVEAYYTLEQLRNGFKAEVDLIGSQAVGGTPPWYADKVLEFQLGDTPIFDRNTYLYKYDNTGLTDEDIAEKRIIKKVAAVPSNGKMAIKVAKEVAGVLSPLSLEEISQLTAYMGKQNYAGVVLSFISRNPDQLRIKKIIYYDGTISKEAFQEQTEAAERAFLKSIDFDGVFYTQKYIDALKNVPGYKDVLIESTEVLPDLDVWHTFIRLFPPVSGYFVFDDANFTQTTYMAQ